MTPRSEPSAPVVSLSILRSCRHFYRSSQKASWRLLYVCNMKTDSGENRGSRSAKPCKAGHSALLWACWPRRHIRRGDLTDIRHQRYLECRRRLRSMHDSARPAGAIANHPNMRLLYRSHHRSDNDIKCNSERLGLSQLCPRPILFPPQIPHVPRLLELL